ncbi:MAG: hypothetical protein K8R76_00990 [Candidatus Aegiribacteria sp.]|nr:hypothetical protein [Candidatus Aegiribacteria sp.]
MSQKISLKEIERKVFTSTFQDGVWDIVLGLWLLTMGIAPLLEKVIPLSDWWIMILSVPVMLALWSGKKFITIPRMGLVKFGPNRKSLLSLILTIVSVTLFLSLFLGVLFATNRIPSELATGISMPVIVWVVLFIVGFSLAAHFLNLNRLYAYGVLFAVALPVRIILKQIPNLKGISLSAYFVSASIILLIGTTILIRFLRDHPIPTAEA